MYYMLAESQQSFPAPLCRPQFYRIALIRALNWNPVHRFHLFLIFLCVCAASGFFFLTLMLHLSPSLPQICCFLSYSKVSFYQTKGMPSPQQTELNKSQRTDNVMTQRIFCNCMIMQRFFFFILENAVIAAQRSTKY